MSKKLPAPWLKSYGNREKSLKYPVGSIYDEVERAASKYPDIIALNYFDRKISYNELMTQIDKAARSFIALGAQKGDAISICSANVPEAIFAIYAASKIGCVANIFHPLSAPNEIRDYLNLVESKILVAIDVAWPNIEPILTETDVQETVLISPIDSLPVLSKLGMNLINAVDVRKNLAKIFQKKPKNLLNWEEFLGQGTHIARTDVRERQHANDTAVIIYSGGTTGKSKGVAISNLSCNAMSLQLESFFKEEIQPGRSVLGIMPIFHGFGLGVGFHFFLTHGMCNKMIPKFNAKKFDRILQHMKPDFLVGIPTLYEAMLRNRRIRKMDLSFIRVAISGGDNLTTPLKMAVDEMFAKRGSKARIIQGYGLTECFCVAVVNLLEYQRDDSIGIPMPDIYAKIVQPGTRTELPTGKIGELCLTGPNNMTGYVNQEQETNQVLQKHADGHVWVHTGDLARMDKDGYIFFAQRLKRMIISSGYNIYPSQVEEVIMKVPEVLIATVVGVPDEYRGQIAKAFVVVKDEHRRMSHSEIRERIMNECKQNLAKYEWPRAIEFRDSLPKTKIGKVAYHELTNENDDK